MILKNSKTTPLGNNRFALDASIGAMQMSDDGKKWEDIKPRLVRDSNGWHVDGAPYYAEVKDDGSRLFCPDRNEKSKYIKFPSHALYSGLAKTAISKQVTMASPYGAARFVFTNTGMYLVFDLVSALMVASKSIDRLCFEVDTNLDIGKLIPSKTGVGITPTLVYDASNNQRIFTPTYKAGILEFGFDLTGMKFPLTIRDAIDVSVGASTDDVRVDWSGSAWTVRLTNIYQLVGYETATQKQGGGMRFLNINIPVGSTIDNGTVLTLACSNGRTTTTVNSVIVGEKSASPATFSDLANYQARRGTVVGGANDTQITSASVAWNNIGDWSLGTSYNSPEIKTIIQEIVSLGTWAGDGTDDIVIFWDDHAGNSTAVNGTVRLGASWDDTTYDPPLLHIEFTPPAGVGFVPKIIMF